MFKETGLKCIMYNVKEKNILKANNTAKLKLEMDRNQVFFSHTNIKNIYPNIFQKSSFNLLDLLQNWNKFIIFSLISELCFLVSEISEIIET